MKPQTQGLQFSLLIHAVVILGILGLSLAAKNNRRPVVIDFDLEKSIPAPSPPVQKAPETLKGCRPAFGKGLQGDSPAGSQGRSPTHSSSGGAEGPGNLPHLDPFHLGFDGSHGKPGCPERAGRVR